MYIHSCSCNYLSRIQSKSQILCVCVHLCVCVCVCVCVCMRVYEIINLMVIWVVFDESTHAHT